MGIKKKLLLKPDAVLTVFQKPSHVLPSQAATSGIIRSLDQSSSSKRQSSTNLEVEQNAQPEPTRSKRNAYEKRER